MAGKKKSATDATTEQPPKAETPEEYWTRLMFEEWEHSYQETPSLRVKHELLHLSSSKQYCAASITDAIATSASDPKMKTLAQSRRLPYIIRVLKWKNAGHSLADTYREHFHERPEFHYEVALSWFAKIFSVEVVARAIRIASDKTDLTSSQDRIDYIAGILRNKFSHTDQQQSTGRFQPPHPHVSPARIETLRQYWLDNYGALYDFDVNEKWLLYYMEWLSDEAIMREIDRHAPSWFQFSTAVQARINRIRKRVPQKQTSQGCETIN